MDCSLSSVAIKSFGSGITDRFLGPPTSKFIIRSSQDTRNPSMHTSAKCTLSEEPGTPLTGSPECQGGHRLDAAGEATEKVRSFFDNSELDEIESYVEDLYLATARPRFDEDPACLRRLRETASTAAGGLTNVLGRKDRSTCKPPQPTSSVGSNHADSLLHATHLLIRSLDNEFPTAMRVRAAGALHRALAFQDVRQRVYGVSQSVISKLADLLRNEPPEGRHQQGREKERRDRPGARSQEWVSKGAGWCEAEKMCKASSLKAVECLRMLALNEGFPEMIASTSAIPVLVHGLSSPSNHMKSMCGGCLVRIAAADVRARLEMVDLGVVALLVELIRSGDPLNELSGWGTLTAVMDEVDAQDAFIKAQGIADLESVLIRRPRMPKATVRATVKATANGKGKDNSVIDRLLPLCQEHALKILLQLCEREQDHIKDNHGRLIGNDHYITTRGIIQNMRAGRARQKHRRFGSDYGSGSSDSNGPPPSPLLCSSYSTAGSSGTSSSTPSGSFSASWFVAKHEIFRTLLKQMRRGTLASKGATVEILTRASKACSREQLDATVAPMLDVLKSDVWKLKFTAARAIPYMYTEDDQKLLCAASGGIAGLVEMLHMKGQQMQGATVAALLSLCENPHVPSLVVEHEAMPILSEYLTTSRDVATRYAVLAIVKIVGVCDKAGVEPFQPDIVVSEHVLGANDDIQNFVREFIEKRKATDYLRVGVVNFGRFEKSDISAYKKLFTQLDKNASGVLDEPELIQLLRQVEVKASEKSILKFSKSIAKDKSGNIDFDEFLDIMHEARTGGLTTGGVLLRRTGQFLDGKLSATQLLLTRQAETLPQQPGIHILPKLRNTSHSESRAKISTAIHENSSSSTKSGVGSPDRTNPTSPRIKVNRNIFERVVRSSRLARSFNPNTE